VARRGGTPARRARRIREVIRRCVWAKGCLTTEMRTAGIKGGTVLPMDWTDVRVAHRMRVAARRVRAARCEFEMLHADGE
jgi:hypothetical protein